VQNKGWSRDSQPSFGPRRGAGGSAPKPVAAPLLTAPPSAAILLRNLAPELQANALADALAEDHPNTAAEIREWSATTRRAMIAVFDQALREKHANKQVELWRMKKATAR